MEKFVASWPDWVRWVCLLPAAFAANLISILLLELAQLLSLIGHIGGGGIILTDSMKMVAQEAVEPIVLAYVAITIAPKKKFVVGIISISFFIILFGLGFLVAIIDVFSGNVKGLLVAMVRIIGVLFALAIVNGKRHKQNPNNYPG
ncbi:MAG: hypothetical protein GX962_13565 [Epulopiscium sp.]|nr:hypothetical protein [Candidatus Epulonipiscium sp.]